MQGPPVDARVIQTSHGFKVRPADVFKHSGDQFTLLNRTDSTVHVSFPELPTVPADASIPSGETQVFNIGNAAPGEYEYHVKLGLSDGTRSFTLRASGNSDPHIFIDF